MTWIFQDPDRAKVRAKFKNVVGDHRIFVGSIKPEEYMNILIPESYGGSLAKSEAVRLRDILLEHYPLEPEEELPFIFPVADKELV